MSNVTKPADPIPTGAELQKFLDRAHAGDKDTIPMLRRLLERPSVVGAFGGELAEQVIVSFSEAMGGKNLVFREALIRKLDLMRTDLLGADPTPVERLLVERILACWVQVQDAELRYAQNQKDMTFKQGDYHQRRMDATHKRYLAALKALALVRKLAIPALQINVARKQVNISTPAVVAQNLTG